MKVDPSVNRPPEARRALIAVDLDQTLIFSARLAPVGAPDAPAVRVVEQLDGCAAAVMTHRAWEQLAALAMDHDVVPVTTRTLDQLRRVELPPRIRWCICANGGRLVTNGEPDEEWERWAVRLAAAGAPLADAEGVLATADDTWVRVRRTADQLFCYLVAHAADCIDAAWLAEADAWAATNGWTLSVQGRKVYLVPSGLSKAAAVRRLRARLVQAEPAAPGRVLLAAGDSLLDAGMLLAADAAVRPSHGELQRRPEVVPGVEVVPGTGLSAGEAVLVWLTEEAAHRTAGPPTRGCRAVIHPRQHS